MFPGLRVLGLGLIVVLSRAVTISGSKVNPPSMFAGALAVLNATGPTFAITGSGLVSVLQSLIFVGWIGIGSERPDLDDWIAHGLKC